MSVLLAIYLGATTQLAVALLGTGILTTQAMGAALVILPLVGVWALVRELMFGAASARLVRTLEAEGTLPEENFERRPSGRPLRDEADAEFPRYAAEVEREPESWRAWLRLGLAYDASGDRRRARSAVRTAIRLDRQESQQARPPKNVQ
jgi:cytochrome c-type biogenesis protein CcmH/NrfG